MKPNLNENAIANGGDANRRQFLQTAMLMGAGLTAGAGSEAALKSERCSHADVAALANDQYRSRTDPAEAVREDRDRSLRARTGGHHLGDAGSAEEAARMVQTAVDAGITFFDNCWEYHNGKSEDWMGRGLGAAATKSS